MAKEKPFTFDPVPWRRLNASPFARAGTYRTPFVVEEREPSIADLTPEALAEIIRLAVTVAVEEALASRTD